MTTLKDAQNITIARIAQMVKQSTGWKLNVNGSNAELEFQTGSKSTAQLKLSVRIEHGKGMRFDRQCRIFQEGFELDHQTITLESSASLIKETCLWLASADESAREQEANVTATNFRWL